MRLNMQWCGCSHDDSYIDNLRFLVPLQDSSIICNVCGMRINQEDSVGILFKAVVKLSRDVDGLQFEKEERERALAEEERERIKDMEELSERIEKSSERFGLLDL
jgi:hypothetical protein